MNHYFLAASLPPIELGQEPELSFSNLILLFSENLSKTEMQTIDRLRWLTDLQNIQRFTHDQPLDPKGSLKRKEIEEALLNRTLLPDYVFEILDQEQDFSKVYLTFFKTEAREEKGFLKRYFAFERALRFCLSAVRCKKLGRDLTQELAQADHQDFIVRDLLASKDSEPQFPFHMRDLHDVLKNLSDDPLAQAQAIAQYRFDKLGELAQDRPFTFEALMIYTLRLMIAEELFNLSDDEGANRLNAQLKETA